MADDAQGGEARGSELEQGERSYVSWWIALFLVVMAVWILLTEPGGVERILRWSGLFLLGAASLLALLPRVRRRGRLTTGIAVVGVLAWLASVVTWIVTTLL